MACNNEDNMSLSVQRKLKFFARSNQFKALCLVSYCPKRIHKTKIRQMRNIYIFPLKSAGYFIPLYMYRKLVFLPYLARMTLNLHIVMIKVASLAVKETLIHL